MTTLKKKVLRAKALHNLDQLLNWSINERLKVFPFSHPLEAEEIREDTSAVSQFAKEYGYFSAESPLIANVTEEEKDFELICTLLRSLEKNFSQKYLEFAVPEILTKGLAYRELKLGQVIPIPHVRGSENYTVEEVFDIWHGMPAFTLKPKKDIFSPILLFRGTDFSFTSQRGWASMMSDLDMAGPGLSTFHNAQENIHAWLVKTSNHGQKPIVMGYSLGGALAAYTYIYENAYLAEKGSVCICSPGVASKVIEDWNQLPKNRQTGLIHFVNAGDVVSKVGTLFGPTLCLSTLDPLKPLTAHTMLMCAESLILKTKVDTSHP